MGAEKLFDRDTFPRYTIKDWEQWEGRWELIEGIAWAMSPAPSSDHQQLNLALAMLFHAALENCKHCKAFLPIDVVINDETIVQPDLTIVCIQKFSRSADF